MVRGFYTAASGIVSQEKKLNAYSNNVANSTTAGYKKDNLVSGTFGEHIAVRMDNYKRQGQNTEIGNGVYMQVIDAKYTDLTQGALQSTDRPFDLAIQGVGFFVVEDAQGNQFLTRNGQFALDDEGYLILPGFGRVQGEDGDIELNTAYFTIAANGAIYLDPEEVDDDPTLLDRLLIVMPTDLEDLQKTETGLYTTGGFDQINEEGDEADYNTVVAQGLLERSNVDMSEEMTRIIASQRGLQSASQMVRMYDEMTGKANETLGRVR